MQHLNDASDFISHFLLLEKEHTPAGMKAQACCMLEYTKETTLESISVECRNQVRAITLLKQLIKLAWLSTKLLFSLLLVPLILASELISPHPVHADPRAFHTGTVVQLRTFCSLNHVLL